MSGLRINLAKSEIVPIGEVLNIDEEYSWMSSNNSSYEILGTSIWRSFYGEIHLGSYNRLYATEIGQMLYLSKGATHSH